MPQDTKNNKQFFKFYFDPHLTYKHSAQGEDNSEYFQSSSAHNIKHNLWKLALRGHLNTDTQARDRTGNILLMRTMP